MADRLHRLVKFFLQGRLGRPVRGEERHRLAARRPRQRGRDRPWQREGGVCGEHGREPRPLDRLAIRPERDGAVLRVGPHQPRRQRVQRRRIVQPADIPRQPLGAGAERLVAQMARHRVQLLDGQRPGIHLPQHRQRGRQHRAAERVGAAVIPRLLDHAEQGLSDGSGTGTGRHRRMIGHDDTVRCSIVAWQAVRAGAPVCYAGAMSTLDDSLQIDRLARRSLAQHRAFATGLLIFMAILTLGSYALPPGWWADLLQASAKAGFVGGVADWFAVTALFRHPLGLPIPHTAIIPAQKERLGRALGRFVATHVFTEAELRRTLGKIDIASILHRFFADQNASKPTAQALAALLPRLLATVEDGRARRLIARLVPRVLGGSGASAVVARALHALLEGGRHQEVLSFILVQFRGLLAAKEDQLRTVIAERVREQGGILVGWALGAQVARRVLTTLNTELDKVGPDGSDLRDAFDLWMRAEISRMETDPARAAEVGAAIRKVVAHETVQAWIWDIWARLRLALEADAGQPGGHTVAFIEGALANFGTLLDSDPAVRARLQSTAESVILTVLPSAQVTLSGFIGDVIANWDTATLIDRLELRVGKDLQYVRVNGTVVGFLVGGALFAGLRAVFGVVAF